MVCTYVRYHRMVKAHLNVDFDKTTIQGMSQTIVETRMLIPTIYRRRPLTRNVNVGVEAQFLFSLPQFEHRLCILLLVILLYRIWCGTRPRAPFLMRSIFFFFVRKRPYGFNGRVSYTAINRTIAR